MECCIECELEVKLLHWSVYKVVMIRGRMRTLHESHDYRKNEDFTWVMITGRLYLRVMITGSLQTSHDSWLQEACRLHMSHDYRKLADFTWVMTTGSLQTSHESWLLEACRLHMRASCQFTSVCFVNSCVIL